MSDLEPAAGMDAICRTVLTKTLRLRRGENVVIESWTHTLRWANAMVLEARRLGIRATMIYEDDASYWRAVAECKPGDVGRMPAPELGALAKAEGYVFFWGPEDRPKLRALPPDQYAALTSYNGAWYEAAEKAHLRGCRMEIGQATVPAARHFGVDAGVWQNTILEASRVDFGVMAREGARLAARLKGGRQLTLRHANGT
ncbi:MAG TPA: hypothetical protein VMH90_05315, partial [Thermoplasmata archaeon]|nr:hypothetical protein [Thermoplasmata archaeon]